MVNQRFSGSSGTWWLTNKGESKEFDRGDQQFPRQKTGNPFCSRWFCMGKTPFRLRGWCHGRIRGIPKSPLCFSAKPLAGDYWGTPPLAEEIKELGITNSLKHGRSTCLFLPMMFMGIWFWYIWFHFYLVYMTLGVCPNPVTVGK